MCKTLTDGDKLLSTVCCNSIVCQNCFIQAWERTDKPRTSSEVRCPKDECFDKKKGASSKKSSGPDASKKGSAKKQVTTPVIYFLLSLLNYAYRILGFSQMQRST